MFQNLDNLFSNPLSKLFSNNFYRTPQRWMISSFNITVIATSILSKSIDKFPYRIQFNVKSIPWLLILIIF